MFFFCFLRNWGVGGLVRSKCVILHNLFFEGLKKLIEFSIEDLTQPTTPLNRKKLQKDKLAVGGSRGGGGW